MIRKDESRLVFSMPTQTETVLPPEADDSISECHGCISFGLRVGILAPQRMMSSPRILVSTSIIKGLVLISKNALELTAEPLSQSNGGSLCASLTSCKKLWQSCADSTRIGPIKPCSSNLSYISLVAIIVRNIFRILNYVKPLIDTKYMITTSTKSILHKSWEWWKRVARKIGDFQPRIILTIFYFIVLGPFALAVRLGSDPLTIKTSTPRGWYPKTEGKGTPIEQATNQF